MKRFFSIIVVILIIFCFSGCGNSSNSINDTEEKNIIDTFDVDKQSIIDLFEETGRYVETNLYEFEDEEANTCGTIRLNPEDYENLFADECIYTQVRTYEDKVFDVYLTYDVSGDEKYYEKLPELSKKVLTTLNSNIEDTFFDDFDIHSNDFYSKDYNNLRYSISYKEWGATETRIEICIVHIKND